MQEIHAVNQNLQIIHLLNLFENHVNSGNKTVKFASFKQKDFVDKSWDFEIFERICRNFRKGSKAGVPLSTFRHPLSLKMKNIIFESYKWNTIRRLYCSYLTELVLNLMVGEQSLGQNSEI